MTDSKPVGLYIHIPFCVGKCPYCDFYSFRADDELKEKYTQKLIEKLKNEKRVFDTVYFGGGTPSQLGSKRLSDILNAVDFTDDAEITVECNPSDTGKENTDFDFALLKNAGVNRISMGLQSARDTERKSLGRRAGCAEVSRGIERAVKAGIDNISLDLMLGVPGQTAESLSESIGYCTHSGASHISAYILKIEENTYFGKNREKLILPDDDTVSDMYLQTVSELEKAGFYQYEISNFSLPGKESRHNLKYWKCEEYLGIGPAAHSFIDGKRFFYPPDIDCFLSGTEPVYDGEGGDEEEYIMLALRLKEGLNPSEFEKRFGYPLPDKFFDYAEKLKAGGLADVSAERICLTPKGFLISNSIICELISRI